MEHLFSYLVSIFIYICALFNDAVGNPDSVVWTDWLVMDQELYDGFGRAIDVIWTFG